MEDIHQPDSRKWISKRINLSSYFERLRDEVQELKLPESSSKLPPSVATLSRMIGIGGKSRSEAKFIVEQIEEATNLDMLNLDVDEDGKTNNYADPLDLSNKTPRGNSLYLRDYSTLPLPRNNCLRTLQYQEVYLQKIQGSNRKTLMTNRKKKYNDSNNIWFESRHEDPVKLNSEILHKEILVVVRIYRPLKYDTTRMLILDIPKCTQELYFLGRNKLTELRDSIKCALDYSMVQDLSDNPMDTKKLKTRKELYKSGFLFINDCFYNDMRWSDCIDYSKVITDWASQPGRKIGKFSTAKMEDTYIKDLDIRLGYPYVYVHHGEHEHLFSFVDARLLSANDPQEVSSYPYERSVGRQNGKYCMACSVYLAKWLTTNNNRVPEDPFYFCDNCFHDFNYDKNDKKIGNFKAFKFIDNNVL